MSKHRRVETKDHLSALCTDQLLQVAQMLGQKDIPSFARLAKVFRGLAISSAISFKHHSDHAETVAQLEGFVRARSKAALARVRDVCIDVGVRRGLFDTVMGIPPPPDTLVDPVRERLIAALARFSNLTRLDCPRSSVAAALIHQRAHPKLRELVVSRDQDKQMLHAISDRAPSSITALACCARPAQIIALPCKWLDNLKRLVLGRATAPLSFADLTLLMHLTPTLQWLVIDGQMGIITNDFIEETFRPPCSRQIVTFRMPLVGWSADTDRLTTIARHCPVMEQFEVKQTLSLTSASRRNPLDILPAWRIWSPSLYWFAFGVFSSLELTPQFFMDSATLVPNIRKCQLSGWTFLLVDRHAVSGDVALIASRRAWMEAHPKLAHLMD